MGPPGVGMPLLPEAQFRRLTGLAVSGGIKVRRRGNLSLSFIFIAIGDAIEFTTRKATVEERDFLRLDDCLLNNEIH